jgi:adenylate cyclase
MPKRRWNFLLSVCWGIVAGELALLLFFLPTAPLFFREINNRVWDQFQKTDIEKPSKKIVIVAWDNETWNWAVAHGGSHELGYKMLAKTIEILKKDGASVIALDIIPIWKTPFDQTFAKILKQCGNVILGTPVGTFKNGREILGVSYVPDNPVIDQAAMLGIINFDPDPDGILRSIELYPRFTPFGILAALAYENKTYEKIAYDYYPFAINSKLFIRYWRNPETLFSTYPFLAVMENKLPPAFFKGKLVFIGNTDASVFSQDVHNTPVGEANLGLSYNLGVFIHAVVARNLLHGSFLMPAPWGWEVFGLFILLIMLSLGMSAEKKGRGFWSTLLVFSISFYLYFFAEHLEHTKGLLVNVAGIEFGIVATYAILFLRRQLLVEQESTAIQKAFTHYVGGEVLKNFMERGDLLAPQGARKELTLLFLDIRGFTSIAENQEAEIVVSQLREFFEAMGEAVLVHGGYINKFLGDGFLALFGLSSSKEHAFEAIQSAQQMLVILEEKNKLWEQKGWARLSIGVGIHSGIVLWGNVGSKAHMEFTVIGDVVNVAARLQELTKQYAPVSVLFSEAVLEKIPLEKRQFHYLELGETLIRGRKTAIKLFGF